MSGHKPRTGIPTLSDHSTWDTVFHDPELIMEFDRNEGRTPYQRLYGRLLARDWPNERIVEFLDRLGFKA